MQFLGEVSKRTEWSVRLQGKPSNITAIQVYAPTINASEAEVEQFSEDLQDLLQLTLKKKRYPFHYRGLECKSRKSRDTWSNGKFGLGVQNESEKRLTEFCQENALVIASILFQQHKRRFYTWTSPDGQHWNHIDIILCNQRWSNTFADSIQSAKTRPGTNSGSDLELIFPIFRLKWKNRKTTRPFRYNLNEIPCYYTVDVTNRFKG